MASARPEKSYQKRIFGGKGGRGEAGGWGVHRIVVGDMNVRIQLKGVGMFRLKI